MATGVHAGARTCGRHGCLATPPARQALPSAVGRCRRYRRGRVEGCCGNRPPARRRCKRPAPRRGVCLPPPRPERGGGVGSVEPLRLVVVRLTSSAAAVGVGGDASGGCGGGWTGRPSPWQGPLATPARRRLQRRPPVRCRRAPDATDDTDAASWAVAAAAAPRTPTPPPRGGRLAVPGCSPGGGPLKEDEPPSPGVAPVGALPSGVPVYARADVVALHTRDVWARPTSTARTRRRGGAPRRWRPGRRRRRAAAAAGDGGTSTRPAVRRTGRRRRWWSPAVRQRRGGCRAAPAGPSSSGGPPRTSGRVPCAFRPLHAVGRGGARCA
ncbi:hypothetical protein I4F81_007527 [Pyropia yezoensis]|uniref:Uncharacterized protein n=1 Tax=Pyropia yezoensis TaxID=2788 RepID=A0ACC3C3W6_PYRYE|nr:hypothetical protein I4F81_007527 [Neopyropia yezoensis]